MRALAIVGALTLLAAAFALGRWSVTTPEPAPRNAGDPAAVIRDGLAMRGSLARLGQLVPVLESLQASELPEVADVYAREISTLGEIEISPLVDAWARVAPDSLIEGIMAWPYPTKRDIGFKQALRALGSLDPPRGLAAYEILAERHPRVRAELQASLVAGWAAADPEGLRAHLTALPGDAMGPPLGTALGMIAQHHGVEALIDWTEGLLEEIRDDALRAKVFRKASRTVARRDLGRAAAWVNSQWGREHAVDGPTAVAEAWILLEPESALDWIETQAPRESRSRAMEVAFGRWVYEDASAARRWLDTSERREVHDPAVAAYARAIGRRTPEEAVTWCEQMIGDEGREACLIGVARAWLQRRPRQAEAWLSESPLDEEAREAVRSWVAQKARRDERAGSPGADQE